MNKAQLVELFRVYEKGLAAKARNKSAENAFVSGLYTYYGKARPATNNNVRQGSKKSLQNFDRDIRALVALLKTDAPNAKALANANKKARQSAIDFYYHIEPKVLLAAAKAVATLKTRRAAPKAPNVDALFKSLVTEAAKVPGSRNRLGRRLGSRPYPPGYMVNFPLPNGPTMDNFKTKINSLNSKWTSDMNLKRMVEATLLRKYGQKNTSFYAKYPNLATGPFRNILNRATNVKKRLQPGASKPSLTASNAQYQILKAKGPNGKTYYGNMPVWKTLKSSDVDRFTNLTAIQKNALKRAIRSVRLNNQEKNKSLVRVGANREELTNDLMKIASNRNLLAVLKARVAKRRAPTEWLTNGAPKAKVAAAPVTRGAPTSLFSRSSSINWRNFNK